MVEREGAEWRESISNAWNAFFGREDIFTEEADKEIGEFALSGISSASSRYLELLEKERKMMAGTYLDLWALNEVFLSSILHYRSKVCIPC